MEYRPLLLEEAEKIREIDAGCHIHNTWWFHSETGTYELKEINWTDHGLPNGLEWHIEHFRHSVADGGDAFGCFDDGKLVAYGTTGSEVFGRMAKYILLDQLFVSKDYRNKHIGRTLLRMCAERARNRGAEKLYLCAGSSEDTVAFYRKMGCVPAMEVQRELFEEAPNDIQLELDIAFVASDMFKDLETERLRLKNIGYDDAEFFLREFSKEEVNRYLYDAEPCASEEEAREWISFYLEDESRNQHRWVLVLKECGEKIGTCGFHRWNREKGEVEIGYDLQPQYWHKGYMTEALREIVQFAVEKMGVENIFTHISIDNVASVKTVEKLGFVKTGKQYF